MTTWKQISWLAIWLWYFQRPWNLRSLRFCATWTICVLLCIFFGVHCFCHAYANFSCHQVEVCLSMFLLIKTNNITRTIQYNIYCHLTQQIRLSSAEHLYIYELYLLNLAACFFLTQLWTSNYWFFCHHSCVYCQLWLLLNDYSLIDWLVTIWAVLEFCKLYFYKVLHIDHSLIRLLES